MSRNGSGTYVAPTGNPVVTGTVIQSTVFNTTIGDIGNEITNSLPRDGQAPMTGNLKITDGLSAQPGVAFNSDPNTGFYRPTAGAISVSVSGSETARFTNGAVTLTGPTNSSLILANASALTNASFAYVQANSGDIRIGSSFAGTGSYLPMTFYTGGVETLRLDAAGNLLTTAAATGAWQVPTGTTAQRPTPATAMIRFNSDQTSFEGYNGTAWTTVGGGAVGGAADRVFVETNQTVTANYTVTSTFNAMSAGPVSINSGVTVTLPTGSTWSIV